ncbi:MAG: hypothetical protein Q9181_001864 [Wetmoreana brouardii]
MSNGYGYPRRRRPSHHGLGHRVAAAAHGFFHPDSRRRAEERASQAEGQARRAEVFAAANADAYDYERRRRRRAQRHGRSAENTGYRYGYSDGLGDMYDRGRRHGRVRYRQGLRDRYDTRDYQQEMLEASKFCNPHKDWIILADLQISVYEDPYLEHEDGLDRGYVDEYSRRRVSNSAPHRELYGPFTDPYDGVYNDPYGGYPDSYGQGCEDSYGAYADPYMGGFDDPFGAYNDPYAGYDGLYAGYDAAWASEHGYGFVSGPGPQRPVPQQTQQANPAGATADESSRFEQLPEGMHYTQWYGRAETVNGSSL